MINDRTPDESKPKSSMLAFLIRKTTVDQDFFELTEDILLEGGISDIIEYYQSFDETVDREVLRDMIYKESILELLRRNLALKERHNAISLS